MKKKKVIEKVYNALASMFFNSSQNIHMVKQSKKMRAEGHEG
jgi:hypothetical protein